jgi:IclR family KDG regulon transcriptional repressor
MPMKSENKFPRTVDKALSVLECVARSGKPIGVSELSAESGISKSTVYRFLQVFLSRGYIDKEVDGSKYRAGFKMLELSQVIVRNIGFRAAAVAHMDRLAKETSQTVGLAILDKSGVVYIDQVGGEEQGIRIHFLIGIRMPFHCTGTGKAMLAFLDENELDRVLQGNSFQRYTPNTITDSALLRRELKSIRKKGYAFNDGEYQEVVRVVASPIFNASEKVVGSLAVAAFKHRLETARVPSIGELVKSAASDISRRLGYGPYR